MPDQSFTPFQIPEPYYLALFEALPGNNVLVKADLPKLTMLAATPTFLEQTESTKEAVIGKGVFEAFPVNTDPNYTGGSELFNSYQHAILKREPHVLPVQRYDLKNEDGSFTEKYWRVSNRPVLSPDGEVAYVINSCEDITAQVKAEKDNQAHQELKGHFKQLQESEARFRSLLTAAPIGIAIYKGRDLVVEMANTTIMELWGKGDGVIGKSFAEIMPELENQPFLKILDDVYTSGETFQTMEAPVDVMRNSKLTRGYYDFSYTPLFDTNGEVYAIMNIATDVSERVQGRLLLEEKVKERTQEWQKANQELQRSNVNLEEFAYAASHDMKEPIRKIHFFSDRIKSTLQDRMTDLEKQSFERMELAAKRMGSLIDDLLSYSQISLRPRTLEAVNMNGLIELVLEDLDLEIEDKRATITVDKLFTVQGHHRQLQQAFHNLIGNSLKYSKPDVAPQIKISCKKMQGNETSLHLSVEEGQKTFYCLTVRDNGIGFEKEDAERIFHVFTRLHGNAEYRGTGIGLSIVRKVVENHNGYIWAESKPGEGAAFHVLLPID
ncbi:PAS domain S-box-containing protein [Cnuella takakiae]|uniref:histidine kinase n=1 Tax=Cnuella takakiae TaxID=1302690 RepID=A0A1M4Z8D1_9BACT|nr:ATP-binding protein [Cnuella takakiae]SHF14274.1 PAS domain S-box-containing protein [Cnuella takakiae]